MNMLNDTSEMQSAKPRLWEVGQMTFYLQQSGMKKMTDIKSIDLKRFM